MRLRFQLNLYTLSCMRTFACHHGSASLPTISMMTCEGLLRNSHRPTQRAGWTERFDRCNSDCIRAPSNCQSETRCSKIQLVLHVAERAVRRLCAFRKQTLGQTQRKSERSRVLPVGRWCREWSCFLNRPLVDHAPKVPGEPKVPNCCNAANVCNRWSVKNVPEPIGF